MKPGDKIKLYMTVREEGRQGEKLNSTRVVGKVWTVVKFFPHFVLLVDRYGIRECFSYWYLRRHLHKPKRVLQNDKGIWIWE